MLRLITWVSREINSLPTDTVITLRRPKEYSYSNRAAGVILLQLHNRLYFTVKLSSVW